MTGQLCVLEVMYVGNGRKTANTAKIRKYRKPLNVNIGMIIFGCIFVYILICVFMYFTSKHIAGYEVKEGSLSTDNVYEGIIIREEQVVTNEHAGYINYYAREGERVAVGDLVYTVDETGKLNEYINAENLGENALSDADLSELKNEIVNFAHDFRPSGYSSAYDFKYIVKGNVLKLANNSLMESINEINTGNAQLKELVTFCRAAQTGIVSYWVDGYETLTCEAVTADVFHNKEYEKKQLISNELIAKDDIAYKLSMNEDWSVVIPIEEARGEELQQEEYVKVRFLKNQYESWGKAELLHNADGTYLKLSFTNSMLTFASQRFVEMELIIHDEVGLKIPNSSIVEKDFFLVPTAYMTKGGNKNREGVLRKVPLEDGTMSTEFIETTVYNVTEEEYYLDTVTLRIGDQLVMPDSTETYTVSKRGTLIGVYNMNKGYADFRQIKILYQNDEYSIVQSNTNYGLNVYDYIVLDAKAVQENEFLHE